jgi:hypothetical protein
VGTATWSVGPGRCVRVGLRALYFAFGSQESLVHPDDREWISEEIAAEVLRRAQDCPDCWIPWEDVKKELDEMDRLGI